ncbi:MAG: hypothetical protein J6Q55_02510, partial [Clostridia bacterium]|nr:hypothetical protein [Clostridia bacterium]
CSQIDGKQLDATYLCKDLLLFGGKTALYNVAYPLILRGYSKQSANEIARQALQNMGIEPTVKVKKLSPTQQVDVVLARLFARNSTLVVIDDFLPLLTDSQRQSLMQFVEQSNSFVVHFTSNVDLSFGATYLWYEDQIFTQNIKEKMQNIFWLNNF